MVNAWRNRQLLKSREGLYLSALLLAIALVGAVVAVQLWVTLGNATLLLVVSLGSAVWGIAGTALMVPRALEWARARGIRVPRTSPVTVQGLVFVGLILLVAGAAVYSGNNLVYLVLSAMLAATLMSGLVSRLNLAGLQLSLGLPDHIFAGSPTLVRVGLRNLKSLIPSFAIRVHGLDPDNGFTLQGIYFPMVASKESATASAEALFGRRGRYKGSSVDLVTRFPFGLVERRVNLELTDRIVAYPSVALTTAAERALKSLSSTAMNRNSGDSHDLYRVRPAVPGDPARLIHWKASAGSPNLWIREFTREAKFSVRLVLDRRASDNELSRRRFEENVSACAAVAWKLTQEGADVTLATDERTLVCRAGEQVYDLLGYLALVEPTGLRGPEPPIGADPEAEYVFGMADESSRPSSSVPQGARGRRTARR